MVGFIYKLTNTLNSKVYIGQTISKVKTRWAAHKRNAKKQANPFFITRAIAKYGHEVFTVETVAEVDIAILDATETAFIDACRSRDPRFGYNIRDGGSGYADEKSERIKNALIGRKAWNKGVKGQVAWNKGLTWDEETRAKMSGPRAPMTEEQRAKRRKVYTPEQIAAKEAKRNARDVRLAGIEAKRIATKAKRDHIAEFGKTSWNKGKSPSEETRAKISATLMGNTPWNLGVPTSAEVRLKQSESHLGLAQSAETIAKRADAIRGQKRTPEQRARISAAKLGKKNSDEHKQACRDAVKALWADPVYRERMLKSRRDKAALRKAA